MKIITVAAEKGGVGKTTIGAYNWAEWLASNGSKVLSIDLDQQASLSETYGVITNTGSAANIFLDQPVEIQQISDNLSIIPGSYTMEAAKIDLNQQNNREYKLMLYFNKYSEKYNWDQYDYIIIDTHPDFEIVTQNAYLASDIILSPVEPSKYGISSYSKIKARLNLFKEQMINPISGTSYFDAKILFFANMIDYRQATSKQLLSEIENEDSFVATIPNRTIFEMSAMRNIPIAKMTELTGYSQYTQLFNEIFHQFNKIKKAVDIH